MKNNNISKTLRLNRKQELGYQLSSATNSKDNNATVYTECIIFQQQKNTENATKSILDNVSLVCKTMKHHTETAQTTKEVYIYVDTTANSQWCY